MGQILEARDISVSFGGVKALASLSLGINDQEVLGLIGPNGSGKTTLISVLSGFIKPTSGRVLFRGTDITGWTPHRIAHRGLCRTFQVVKPFGSMTVLDNVATAAKFGNTSSAGYDQVQDLARELLELVGLTDHLRQPALELTSAAQKKLELARVLATGARLVLLDEVMSGLNMNEVQKMIDVIRKVRSARQLTFLIVEHVLRAVMSLADRVLVLNQGQVLTVGTPAEVVREPAVIKAYLGRRHAVSTQREAPAP